MMKTAIATIALMTAFVAFAPGATASPDPDKLLCPTPSPEAWVNYCVKVEPTIINAYRVETRNLVYEPVCPVPPVPDRCINVPTLPSVIAALEPKPIDAYTISARDTSVNGQAILYDVCVIVFGSPEYCNFNALAYTDLDGNGVIDGVVANNVFLPMGPA